MSNRLTIIQDTFGGIENVAVIEAFTKMDSGEVRGKIAVTEQNATITFDVNIYAHYPFHCREHEAIRFINSDLLEFNHVNADGSVCVHTVHHPSLAEKIRIDVHGLKMWIDRYYVKASVDSHYEHIIVPVSLVAGSKMNFLFREVDHDFKKGDYGTVAYSEMSEGELSKETIRSMIVQHFKINKEVFECRWNLLYKSMATSDGVFFFSEDPPVHHKRFAIENFEDLQPRVTQDFLKFLNEARKRTKNGKAKNVFIPLFIGYRIPGNEVHWQVILVPLDHYPVQAYKNEKGNWEGEFISQKVMWAQTRNIAPKYFFGRGTLHEKLTTANILVIGVGAIGSMVATTFVRGGITKISLIDHDLKEPENVCRSEYQFGDGLTAKVTALERQLLWISPFVEVLCSENFMDMSKIMMNMEKSSNDLKIFFEKFDYILDCTTDNDVAYILSTLDIRSRVISMSITNHARELVCAVSPNVYRWTMDIFNKLSRSDDDLYHPTGCWSPTFKASYNDIAALVQFAIRQINQYLQNDQPLRNFYLSTSADDGFQIKTYQF